MRTKIFFITFLLFIATTIFGSSCYADDPCKDAKKRIEVLADALNDDYGGYWTGLQSDGKFRVTSHNLDHDVKYYEISYVSKGNIVAEGIIQSFNTSSMEDLVVKIADGGKKLDLIYSSGKSIQCSFSIIPSGKEGFKVFPKR